MPRAEYGYSGQALEQVWPGPGAGVASPQVWGTGQRESGIKAQCGMGQEIREGLKSEVQRKRENVRTGF